MNSPTHQEKREIFERHFLFGKLSAGEIDSLISYARVEHYPAGHEIFAQRVVRPKLGRSIAGKHQDQLALQ